MLPATPATPPPPPPYSSAASAPLSSHFDQDEFARDIFGYTLIPSFWLDSDFIIRQVSDSYLTFAGGRKREEIVGLHAANFLNQNTVPSLYIALKAIRCADKSRRPYELNNIVPHAINTTKLRVVPVYRHGHLRCIQMELQDTTLEYQKQLDLQERIEANEIFRLLVNTAKDYAIFMLDSDGNVATWNQGAETLKGYTRDEIIGKHFSIFYGQEDHAKRTTQIKLEVAIRDDGVECRANHARANVVITLVYRERTLIGFSKVTRDLTEKRASEACLFAAYEEASELKSEFLTNMSHEIRTPLHVVNDILDYSKLASGRFSISSDIVSVSDIIQSVLQSHQHSKTSSTKLEAILDPKLPKTAEGDSLRYRQIVQNLLSNALKFTEEGYDQVNATLQEEDGDSYQVLTEVVDTGIGVPDASVGSLFTPFTQFDNSASKRYKGTGLGLSICKGFVELMSGRIGFRPNPNCQGSVFYFTCRLKKVKQHKLVNAVQDGLEITAVDSPVLLFKDMKLAAINTRILLAEDNLINQRVNFLRHSIWYFSNWCSRS
ncbi:hypothetical protein K458DRAFT_468083 [Lentithecium fluviatile CBS 122367]|uniref:histidine kinase n=1 Tax=Lentithecium fluviatile CBS 122367 TaxID=1168545 RepID=A0A6G1IFP5_9PLEO|nr:hypothetical protein K458DRAFT_468083 [Lentithecium fluviatile CBS 122367]